MSNITFVNTILKAFKQKYPKAYPTVIFEIDDGYLIEAPMTKNDVDYDDPYYLVSFDLSEVDYFPMTRMDELFEAFKTEPIWIKGDSNE